MFTPVKRHANTSPYNAMAYKEATPNPSFSRELRQALWERNILTCRTKHQLGLMLDSSDSDVINPEILKRKDFRMQAIAEIIETEKTYLSLLEMLLTYFAHPTKHYGLIDNVTHSKLFGQIDVMYSVNKELLRELGENMENVAAAFLKMAPYFKLYASYAFGYKETLFTLQQLTSKSTALRRFIEDTETRPDVQHKLNSLMILPIQRVPRYKLLLEQVLLYTSPADPDYKALRESVKQVELAITHINGCIQSQEVMQQLINLQNSLVHRTPHIVEPSRTVIKEGVLEKTTRDGSQKKRYLVLMSDIFMYCKIKKERASNTATENSLECCCIFPLKKCKVCELFPGTFKVSCQGDGAIFRTTDIELGRVWVSTMLTAIDQHIQFRRTLRKDSSKRRPLRNKDLKNYGSENILSPKKRKNDYEKVFHNGYLSDSDESVSDGDSYSFCFPCQRSAAPSIRLPQREDRRSPAQCFAPRSSPPSVALSSTTNYLSSLCKMRPRKGILKCGLGSQPVLSHNSQHDESYGFAGRSDKQTHSSINTLQHRATPPPVQATATRMWRSNNNSHNCSMTSNINVMHRYAPSAAGDQMYMEEGRVSPSQTKRVKFDESTLYAEVPNANYRRPPLMPRSFRTTPDLPLPVRLMNAFCKKFH